MNKILLFFVLFPTDLDQLKEIDYDWESVEQILTTCLNLDSPEDLQGSILRIDDMSLYEYDNKYELIIGVGGGNQFTCTIPKNNIAIIHIEFDSDPYKTLKLKL